MNQADVSKLVSQLRIKVAPRHRNLKSGDGPEGRLRKLRHTVTGLFKHERIELNWNRADEARGYAERLISDAIRHGDCHRPTMEMADYWLLEKQLVHKLFKVLAPRFANCNTSYTRLIRTSMHVGDQYPRAVLELRGHPYPPLFVDTASNKNLIHNVLLDEAKKEYRSKKYAEMAEKLREEERKAEMQQATAQVEETVELRDTAEVESIETAKLSSGTRDDPQAHPAEIKGAQTENSSQSSQDQRIPTQEQAEEASPFKSDKEK